MCSFIQRLFHSALSIALFFIGCAGSVYAGAMHGMVASVHPLATDAGVRVLQQGGNAVDAAVAVGLTLGVADGGNSGLGGGCYLLIRRDGGAVVALDGRETAPAAAARNMFVGRRELSQTGPLASGVPGALLAYEYAVEHYGRKKLKDLILPAAEVADNCPSGQACSSAQSPAASIPFSERAARFRRFCGRLATRPIRPC